jgi:hypothetical protein
MIRRSDIRRRKRYGIYFPVSLHVKPLFGGYSCGWIELLGI